MSIREWLLEEVAGDLEYNPRRAAIYVSIGALAIAAWAFARASDKYGVTPLVFGLGGLALIVKGVFMFRKESAGLGMSERPLMELSKPSNAAVYVELGPEAPQKQFPEHAAQFVKDFAAGPLLFWPLIRFGATLDGPNPRMGEFPIFLTGAVLYSLGWLLRRLTQPDSSSAK